MENATNIGKFCVMDTSHKRLGWVCINTPSMKISWFNLKWETFVGRCFGCGEWGHFMAECQHLCHSIMEIPNERNGKEGVGRDVVSDILVVTKEHHPQRCPTSKLWA